MNDTRKEAICNALAAFIRQRPGLDPRNYISHGMDEAGRRAYFADKRAIERDKRDAETLLRAVRHNDGISADALLEASRSAYSGRLTIEKMCYCGNCHKYVRDSAEVCPNCEGPLHATGTPCYGIDYCTGQYFPTEYRRAAAAVCASALWAWQRENMPPPITREGGRYYLQMDRGGAVPAGDWLRRKFRQEFGSALQKRYFD